MVSLGLGLTVLASVALIQGNIRREVLGGLPKDAPSFFFIDIQNGQLAQFERIAGAQPGISDLHEVPSLRARIVSLKGVAGGACAGLPRQRLGAGGRPRPHLLGAGSAWLVGRGGRLVEAGLPGAAAAVSGSRSWRAAGGSP